MKDVVRNIRSRVPADDRVNVLYQRKNEVPGNQLMFDPRVHIRSDEWEKIFRLCETRLHDFSFTSVIGQNASVYLPEAVQLARLRGEEFTLSGNFIDNAKKNIDSSVEHFRKDSNIYTDISIHSYAQMKQLLQHNFPSGHFTQNKFKKDAQLHLHRVDEVVSFAIVYAEAFRGVPLVQLARIFHPSAKDPIGMLWEDLKRNVLLSETIRARAWRASRLRLLFPERFAEEKEDLFSSHDWEEALKELDSERSSMNTVNFDSFVYSLTLLGAEESKISPEGYVQITLEKSFHNTSQEQTPPTRRFGNAR